MRDVTVNIDLNDKIVSLETKSEFICKEIETLNKETIRNRDGIHDINNKNQVDLNIIRESHGDLKELVMNNSHQISSLIEKHEKMEKVISNNTKVMIELKGGIKTGVWILSSLGGLTSVGAFLKWFII